MRHSEPKSGSASPLTFHSLLRRCCGALGGSAHNTWPTNPRDRSGSRSTTEPRLRTRNRRLAVRSKRHRPPSRGDSSSSVQPRSPVVSLLSGSHPDDDQGTSLLLPPGLDRRDYAGRRVEVALRLDGRGSPPVATARRGLEGFDHSGVLANAILMAMPLLADQPLLGQDLTRLGDDPVGPDRDEAAGDRRGRQLGPRAGRPQDVGVEDRDGGSPTSAKAMCRSRLPPRVPHRRRGPRTRRGG